MSAPDSALSSAWQAALAAELQAVFGYGIVQAHLAPDEGETSSPQFDLAVHSASAHSELSESMSANMVAMGVTPIGPQADYPALYPVTSAKQAQALAARLEDDCCSSWRALYAACAPTNASNTATPSVPAGLRTSAQQALTASAVRATRWRRQLKQAPLTTPFPGL